MSDFEFREIIKKEEIPEPRNGKNRDYTDLFEKFNRTSSGNCLYVSVKSRGIAKSIKTAFKNKYGSSKFELTQRAKKNSEELDVYIIRN